MLVRPCRHKLGEIFIASFLQGQVWRLGDIEEELVSVGRELFRKVQIDQMTIAVCDKQK